MSIPFRGHWPFAVILMGYVLWALYAIFFGERIPVNGGLGWDGKIYYFISQDFFEFVRARVFDGFYVQRVVPSLLVKAMHAISHTDHDYRLTGTFFGMLNLVSMVMGTMVLYSSLRDVPMRWRWMAAVFALVSFSSVRHVFYYPILTDAFSFLLGSAMLWAFLRSKRRMLACSALLGAFTVPTLLLMAFPLMVLGGHATSRVSNASNGRWILLMILIITSVVAIAGPAFNGTMPFGTFQPSRVQVLAGLPFVLTYVGYLWWDVDAYRRFRQAVSQYDRVGLGRWAIVFLMVLACVIWARPSSFSGVQFPLGVVSNALTFPAVSAVAHISYLGPAFLLMLLFSRSVKRELLALPLPLYWTLMIALMLLLNSESRTLMAGLPFLLYLIVRAVGHITLTNGRVAVLLVLTLLLSKFWFPINSGEMTGDFLQFPMQRYFMHLGPWMTTQTYLIQLCITVASGLFVGWGFRSETGKK